MGKKRGTRVGRRGRGVGRGMKRWEGVGKEVRKKRGEEVRIHKQDPWTRGLGEKGGRERGRLDGTPVYTTGQVGEREKSTHFHLVFYLIPCDSSPRFSTC